MKIIKCLGAKKEEVESKKFNIWIGVSLGNKYFTKENMKKYIEWALENTKEDVLIVIADRLHAINLEVLDKYNKLRAFRVSSRLGDKKEKEVLEIISELSEQKRKLIKIKRLREIVNTKYHDYRLEIIFEEFKKNKSFRDHIVNIVKDNKKSAPHTLTEERVNKLAEYILRELPLYLNSPYSENKYYQCTIYPGLGLIDELIVGLHAGKLFPDFSKKLKIHNQIAIIEGYVD
jgi:tRNA-dependent cyclodipeptide synthase